jgi:hypothetical protein
MSSILRSYSLEKPNKNIPENNITHTLIIGLVVFSTIVIVLSLIAFFMYSNVNEAYWFRHLFYSKPVLVPRV